MFSLVTRCKNHDLTLLDNLNHFMQLLLVALDMLYVSLKLLEKDCFVCMKVNWNRTSSIKYQ